MFKSKITQAQMDKIVDIGMESKDNMNALVAYGGDLYRQGIIKGAIVCTYLYSLAYIAGDCIFKICAESEKRKKIKQKKEEES